jgi:DNA-binding transcriptional LysR family regulator
MTQSWDDYRFFLAVARQGSLSRAARTLGVNASTVHRRMHALEAAMSARLFDRRAKAYALTPSGEALLEAASRVEAEVFAAGRGVMGRDLDPSGPIRFTTADVFAMRVLERPLATFHAAHPDIELIVSVGPATKSLSRREADVALRPGPKPTEPDVIARHISRVPVALYGAASYLAGRRAVRRLSDIDAHAIVTGDESVEHVRFIRGLRERAPNAKIAYRSDSVLNQLVAVQAGFGIAALPCFIAEDAPGIRRVFGPVDDFAVDAWLAIHRDLRHTARVRVFVEHLADAIAKATASI